MAWLSILPESLSYIETWVTRFFFICGALFLFPWVALVAYDFLIYVIRVVTYELPIVGGRARNRPRPRAPSLSERPDGQPREPPIPTAITSADLGGSIDEGAESVQHMDGGATHRRTTQGSVEDKSTHEQLQL